MITDGCHNCNYRLKPKLFDYRGKGCKHKDMKGFVCLAFANEGIATLMVWLDDDDSKCECWVRKETSDDHSE